MKMIEYLASARRLADVLDLAQSDGLQAKGCSLDLILPQNDTGSWEGWLDTEYADEYDAEEAITEMRHAVEAKVTP